MKAVERKRKTEEQVNPEDDDSLNLSLSLNTCPVNNPQSKPLSPSPSLSLDKDSPIVGNDPLISNDNPRHDHAQVIHVVSPIINNDPPTAPKPKRVRGGRSKSDTITPPYPWATDRRATLHTLQYLLDKGIHTISGQVECNSCEKKFIMELQIQPKLNEIAAHIVKDLGRWHVRAPENWIKHYKFPDCRYCGQKGSCKPVISEKKRSINWLFLVLVELVGCCTLEQLKYFCKHTNIHRTGAKNRLVLSTFIGICKQLDPNGILRNIDPNWITSNLTQGYYGYG